MWHAAKLVFVFLSYAHSDQVPAINLAHELRTAGCRVWIDTDLKAGDQWTRKVERAIDRADVFIALISAQSYKSYWVRAEQLRAIRKNKRIVPVVLDTGTDIPVALEGLHRIPADKAVEAVRCR